MDQLGVSMQEGKIILCVNSRKHYIGLSNHQKHGTIDLTHYSSMRVILRPSKPFIVDYINGWIFDHGNPSCQSFEIFGKWCHKVKVIWFEAWEKNWNEWSRRIALLSQNGIWRKQGNPYHYQLNAIYWWGFQMFQPSWKSIWCGWQVVRTSIREM